MIGWEEPRAPQKYQLLVCSAGGHAREATEEDLRKAGYVKRANDDGTISVEVREAEAWRKIDKWCRNNKEHSTVHVGPWADFDGWFARAQNPQCVYETRGEGLTKTEALESLAEWC